VHREGGLQRRFQRKILVAGFATRGAAQSPLPNRRFACFGLCSVALFFSTFANGCVARPPPLTKQREAAPPVSAAAASPDAAEVPLELEWTNPVPSTCPPLTACAPYSPSQDAGTDAGDGGSTVSNASAVVRGMRASFRACYNAQLARGRHSEGRLKLKVYVDCAGRISSIRSRSLGLDRETLRCLLSVGERHRFAPPACGTAVVQVPVWFVPNDRVRPQGADEPSLEWQGTGGAWPAP
jgi:hypothetical protein